MRDIIFELVDQRWVGGKMLTVSNNGVYRLEKNHNLHVGVHIGSNPASCVYRYLELSNFVHVHLQNIIF